MTRSARQVKSRILWFAIRSLIKFLLLAIFFAGVAMLFVGDAIKFNIDVRPVLKGER